jgi:hypothetical protein
MSGKYILKDRQPVYRGADGIDEYQERCSTWEEAEAMHAKAVAWVRERDTSGMDWE